MLAVELRPSGSQRPPTYLDARVPSFMHLRLVAALFKPGTGQLSQPLQDAYPDPALRLLAMERIAAPRRAITVLDDRPLAPAIGPLTAERGVSVAFAALIAQAAGQPILTDPRNEARWADVARARGVEVMVRPTGIAR